MQFQTEFWQLAAGHDVDLALIDPALGAVTYGELRADVAAASQVLHQHAQSLGTDRLLIGLELTARSPVIAYYLAALSAGHAVYLCAKDTFHQGDTFSEAYAPNVTVKMSGDHCVVTAKARNTAKLHPDLRLLLSTSGTTGDPKLVRLSAENLSSNAAAIAQYLDLQGDDRAVTTLPLHYIFGLSVLHAHLQVGASVVLTDLSVSDAGFAPLFTEWQGTSISVVPHQIDLLLAGGFKADALPGLRYIAQAGGKLAPSKVAKMAQLAQHGGWSFFVMYGQTEASPRMAYLSPDAAMAHADCVGQAIEGGKFHLRGDDGHEITLPNTPGELIYTGPNVMMGYAHSRDDLARPKDTFDLATGDVAVKTDAGLIRIVGRQASFVKLFGLRISLGQVEALMNDAGFAGYAVAVDDNLVLMLTDINAKTPAQKLVAVEYGLPVGAIRAEFLPNVPILQNGKTDLKALSNMARIAMQEPEQQASHGKTLQQIMAEATRHETVPLNASYIDLGGDSLGYLHVQIALERHLGVAPTGWENMPLRQLQSLLPDHAALHSFWSRLDMDLALRVVATICVILVHLAGLPVAGGTWLLILLMGFSFARFQRPRLLNLHFKDVLLRMLHPILLLYFLLLLIYEMARGSVSPLYFLLLGNSVSPGQSTLLTVYWFVSLYAQLVVVLVAMYCVPLFRQAQQRNTWLSTVLVFGGAISLAAAALLLSPDPIPDDPFIGILGYPIAARSLVICLPIVLAGMIIQSAQGTLQNCVALTCLFMTCALFPETFISQPFLLAAGGTMLILFKTVKMPTLMVRLITIMAANTMFVYLLHNVLVHIVRYSTPTMEIVGIFASAIIVVPVSFIVSHWAKWAFDVLDRKFRAQWSVRPNLRVGAPRP